MRAKAEATGYLQTLRKFDQNASEELSEKYLAEAKELLSKADLEQASEKFWGAAALKNLSLKKKALPKKKEVKVEMKRSRGEIVGSALVAAFVVVVAVFPTAVSVSATAAERGAEGRRREERQS